MNIDWLKLALGILVTAGGAFTVVLTKWTTAKKLLKEVAEALTDTSNALADDDVTASERQTLLKSWAEVIQVARELVGK